MFKHKILQLPPFYKDSEFFGHAYCPGPRELQIVMWRAVPKTQFINFYAIVFFEIS